MTQPADTTQLVAGLRDAIVSSITSLSENTNAQIAAALKEVTQLGQSTQSLIKDFQQHQKGEFQHLSALLKISSCCPDNMLSLILILSVVQQ